MDDMTVWEDMTVWQITVNIYFVTLWVFAEGLLIH